MGVKLPGAMERYAAINWVPGNNLNIEINVEGEFSLELVSTNGRRIAFHKGFGKQVVRFQNELKNGIYFLELSIGEKKLSKKLVRF